ncbi:unnamed protein product [Ilex paraguariensis]|uniref:Uncharacterized protein n=1 Tax=Ilex paraguariensis TaxID=185542 RepID=A0ABC8U780_9AQUA
MKNCKRKSNQKLAEEASYAKELASAAAFELKNLASEVTKLSLQSAKLQKNSSDLRPGRKGLLSGQAKEVSGITYDDFDLEGNNVKVTLEDALAEKELVEVGRRKKVDEAKKMETTLENDLANMWVLVAQLKKEAEPVTNSITNERHNDGTSHVDDGTGIMVLDVTKLALSILKGELLFVRLRSPSLTVSVHI